MGGGTILDLGIYPLQFVSYIFDEEKPVAVKAAGHLNSDGVDESMSATLIYKNGRTATIATHAQVNLPNEAQIIGTKGVIKIPTFWAPTRAEFPDGSVFEKPVPVSKIAPNFVNSGWLSCEAAEVRQCLQKGTFYFNQFNRIDLFYNNVFFSFLRIEGKYESAAQSFVAAGGTGG